MDLPKGVNPYLTCMDQLYVKDDRRMTDMLLLIHMEAFQYNEVMESVENLIMENTLHVHLEMLKSIGLVWNWLEELPKKW